ncbi:MAG: hypothetical protein EOP42_01085 [Sphingobacteriaceae bacterium]|nr:MAG: hypothetical protein EOP42_01085 [Sphingobacteriaceae bacterium]
MITELQPEIKHNLTQHKPEIVQGVAMEKLIGAPHLFARYCDTREGFTIVPLGTMTMQADGRVTGYSHPNEGFWQPYEYGTVAADAGFAFVGAGNRFIPSSTWQQTFADMPIGFYCGEPEMPQKLCLVPNTKNEGEAEVVYVIATCLRFYQKTIPKLLQELLSEGIEAARIKVVINGCEENDDQTINGVDYAFSTHNAWELTALYEAPLRWQFDYAMLIHDTNEIYPGFKRRVESFNNHLQWDHLPATPMARCLLGLYSHDFLLRTNDWLKKVDQISKKDAIIAEVAGELIHRAKSVLVMSDPESNGGVRPTEWRETADFFNSGTIRVRRVFPAINLHKFTHVDLSDAVSL